MNIGGASAIRASSIALDLHDVWGFFFLFPWPLRPFSRASAFHVSFSKRTVFFLVRGGSSYMMGWNSTPIFIDFEIDFFRFWAKRPQKILFVNIRDVRGSMTNLVFEKRSWLNKYSSEKLKKSHKFKNRLQKFAFQSFFANFAQSAKWGCSSPPHPISTLSWKRQFTLLLI